MLGSDTFGVMAVPFSWWGRSVGIVFSGGRGSAPALLLCGTGTGIGLRSLSGYCS